MTGNDLLRLLTALPPERLALPIGASDREYGWREALTLEAEIIQVWPTPEADYPEDRDVLNIVRNLPT